MSAPPGFELTGPLVECVLPGINVTFPEALSRTIAMCSDAHEYKIVFLHVYERLSMLWEALLTKETDEAHSEVIKVLLPRFIAQFNAFWKLIGRFPEKGIIDRLAENRVTMNQIIQCHRELDAMLVELNPQLDEQMDQWRLKNESDWRDQQAVMKIELETARAIGGQLNDGEVVELLTILKFELDYHYDDTAATQMAMLQETIDRLEFASKITIVEPPRWFIPSYEVQYTSDPLPEGTFGNVCRGSYFSGAQVIIKRMMDDSDAGRKKFMTEATIWKDLEHPHLIRLYGICHVGKPTFFVCEDATRGNFADYFRHENNRRSMWRLFYEASLGMVFLHGKKSVHGNLKCRNLLIGSDEKARVSDFGFAFHRSASKALSKKAQAEGVRWKSPECLRGDEENPSFKSDVYCFGLCIIEAFTCQDPWGGDSTDEDIIYAAFDHQSPICPPDMSADVWVTVEKMVQSDPKYRISMDEVCAELEVLAIKEKRSNTCSICAQPLSATDRFCGHCGTPTADLTANSYADLMYAAQIGNKNIQAYLSAEVSVNAKDDFGKTALIYAASGGHIEVVRTLIQAGALLNDVDNEGETAMMHAIKSNQRGVVMEFLRDENTLIDAVKLMGLGLQKRKSDETKRRKANSELKYEDLQKLCPKMHESRAMHECVYSRIKMVGLELQSIEHSNGQETTKAYNQILEKIHSTMLSHADKHLVTRLVGMQAMIDTCRNAHRDIDTFLENFDIKIKYDNWIDQWENDASIMKNLLAHSCEDKQALLSELKDPKVQAEAIMLLLYASNDRETEYSDTEMTLINDIFRLVTSFSKLKIPNLPKWFVPGHKVELNSDKFASGSYASVHLGYWSGNQMVIKRPTDEGKQSRDMFLKEVEIWFNLDHPNIVKLYRACHVGRPFFVCEYASRGTLLDACISYRESKQSHLIWELLYEAACGLNYLHLDMKVVHGDLKCNNILVSSDWTAKLADFGLSFVSKDTDVIPSLSELSERGALRWKAPEVIAGNIRGSFESDVYSFGMCIVEALTGSPPYGTMPDAALKLKVLERKQLPIQPTNANEEQWNLVKRMCAWEPANRLVTNDVVSLLRSAANNASHHAYEQKQREGLEPVSPPENE